MFPFETADDEIRSQKFFLWKQYFYIKCFSDSEINQDEFFRSSSEKFGEIFQLNKIGSICSKIN